jgi:hypothetical protein
MTALAFYLIAGFWVFCVGLCAVMVYQETRAAAHAAKARARRRLEDYRMQQYARKQGLQ